MHTARGGATSQPQRTGESKATFQSVGFIASVALICISSADQAHYYRAVLHMCYNKTAQRLHANTSASEGSPLTYIGAQSCSAVLICSWLRLFH